MKKNNRVVGKVVNGRIIMLSENGGYIKPVSRPVEKVVEEPKKKAPTKRNRISARPIPVSDDVPEFVRTAIRSRAKHEEEKQEDKDNKIVTVHEESLPEMFIDWAIGLGMHAVRPLTKYFQGDKVKDIFKEETR